MRKISSLAILILLLSACGAVKKRINASMDAWTGKHYSDLIAAWGPPQQIIDLGEDGKLLVWVYDRGDSERSVSTTTIEDQTLRDQTLRTETTYDDSTGWKAYRMFWANAEGIIYRWSWRGL